MFEKMLFAIKPQLFRMYDHPFNRGLADGSLPRHVFNQFLRLDKKYLFALSQALAITGKRMPKTWDQQLFQELAEGTLQTQRKLHNKYLFPKSVFFQEQSTNSVALNRYIYHLQDTSKNKENYEAVACLIP